MSLNLQLAIAPSIVTALLLGGCGDSTGPATATLIAVSPLPGATAVAPSPTITLSFGQPMMAGMDQYLDLHAGGITGPVMPMNCSWSPDRTVLTCTPANPLAPGTQFAVHLGSGMQDAQDHRVVLDPWTGMGGQWVTSAMIGGTHGGQPVGMMGPGWMDGSGHYGMTFTFTTS